MHPFALIILIGVVVYCSIKFVINPLIKKKDAKKAQEVVNKNVEWQINEHPLRHITISTLTTHSSNEKVASIIASRIVDYIDMGAHPEKLYQLFENLGLLDYCHKEKTSEITLSALIKHYTLENLRAHDIKVYQSVLSGELVKGFDMLNKTFITKVKNNMLVWSPN